jgi:hypothetical protein
MNQGYGCSQEHIAHYTSCRTPEPISIDGDLEKPVWQRAQKSPRFVDMVTGEPGFFDTRSAVLWDDQHLYIAFWVEEPFVQAHLTQRDSLIFNENDIEVFIDGGDAYYEFEINALGTVYEVFFIWQDAYKRGGPLTYPSLTSSISKPCRSAATKTAWRIRSGTAAIRARPVGPFSTGIFPGCSRRCGCRAKSTTNSVVDKGWTVELAFPVERHEMAGQRPSLPPKDGDTWRLFLGRFQKLTPGGQEVAPHPAWAWNKHGCTTRTCPSVSPTSISRKRPSEPFR